MLLCAVLLVTSLVSGEKEKRKRGREKKVNESKDKEALGLVTCATCLVVAVLAGGKANQPAASSIVH